MTRQGFIELLQAAASKWNEHNAPRLGASLAYYTLLSMAPLAVLLVRISELIFKKTAEQQLLSRVAEIAGYSSAKTVQMLLSSAHQANGTLATLIAVITLLFGASGVFVELRDSLNTIWEAPPPSSSTWRDWVGQRLMSFVMVLALGILLLLSLALSAVFTFFQRFLTGVTPVHFAVAGEVANFVVSFAGLAVLFALIFKFVPNVPIAWREVAIGALATAVLFDIGKALVGFYLGTAGIGSTYGAAGSLVALVVWVYYSAQIFFFGAVLTRVYADRYGTKAAKKERAAAKQAAEVVDRTDAS